MAEALIVFARRPVPGTVKTRLTTQLRPEDAARLYDAFLRDALSQYATLGVALRVYVAPGGASSPSLPLPSKATEHTQQGEGLGVRMANAFAETFAAGYQRVVVVGTDHPSLPTDFLQLAFDTLEHPQSLCIGPCDDGGFYLLGMNELHPVLFHDMTYSHDQVFRETVARAGRTRATLTVLPAWYDVDTPDALRRLIRDLEDPHIVATETRRVLKEMEERHLLGDVT